MQADVDSATHDMVAQCCAECCAGGQSKLDLICTHTRMCCRCYMRRWSEPFDLHFFLSQTKYNWSLSPVDADVERATHDMVAQCGAGGQFKLDLMRRHTSVVSLLNAKMV
jgi:hypothetical protein